MTRQRKVILLMQATAVVLMLWSRIGATTHATSTTVGFQFDQSRLVNTEFDCDLALKHTAAAMGSVAMRALAAARVRPKMYAHRGTASWDALAECNSNLVAVSVQHTASSTRFRIATLKNAAATSIANACLPPNSASSNTSRAHRVARTMRARPTYSWCRCCPLVQCSKRSSTRSAHT